MKENRSIPSASVIPVLVVEDVARHVEWLVSVLGFRERVRIPPNHRTQLTYGDGAVIVAERGAAGPQNVLLRVEDARAVLDRALAAGATQVTELADHVYGERQAAFDDPARHRWTISESLTDVEAESWGGVTVA